MLRALPFKLFVYSGVGQTMTTGFPGGPHKRKRKNGPPTPDIGGSGSLSQLGPPLWHTNATAATSATNQGGPNSRPLREGAPQR